MELLTATDGAANALRELERPQADVVAVVVEDVNAVAAAFVNSNEELQRHILTATVRTAFDEVRDTVASLSDVDAAAEALQLIKSVRKIDAAAE